MRRGPGRRGGVRRAKASGQGGGGQEGGRRGEEADAGLWGKGRGGAAWGTEVEEGRPSGLPKERRRIVPVVCGAAQKTSLPPAAQLHPPPEHARPLPAPHPPLCPSGEKSAIARRYLEPQAATDAGVPKGACVLGDEPMEALINEYCREAGVRSLKKHIEKVLHHLLPGCGT